MAKQKQIPQVQSPDAGPQAQIPAVDIQRQQKAGVIYVFPTKSRCPRCGTTDTVATSTQGAVQYRRCRRGICRHKYAVRGAKI